MITHIGKGLRMGQNLFTTIKLWQKLKRNSIYLREGGERMGRKREKQLIFPIEGKIVSSSSLYDFQEHNAFGRLQFQFLPWP